eukprot:scaffold6752_cov92-Isochrysis_galbana.AAC.1
METTLRSHSVVVGERRLRVSDRIAWRRGGAQVEAWRRGGAQVEGVRKNSLEKGGGRRRLRVSDRIEGEAQVEGVREKGRARGRSEVSSVGGVGGGLHFIKAGVTCRRSPPTSRGMGAFSITNE